MKINWKVRFRNKTFVLMFAGAVIAFVYNILGMFDIVPALTESAVTDVLVAVSNVLCMVGIINDPTTAGIDDSAQALTYETPKETEEK